MKSIRHKSFETNSSSSHSISIVNAKSYDTRSLPVTSYYKDSKGVEHTDCVVLSGGEFGWEVETYNDAVTKANYLAIAVDQLDKDDLTAVMFHRVLREMTGAKSVVIDLQEWSYIDHQSSHVPGEALESEEALKAFIFNPHSELHTDNDNH